MTAERKWLLGGIAAVIVVFLLGFFLLVNPARNQAAAINEQAQQTEENNVRLRAKLAQLEQQSAEVPAKLSEIEAVEVKMPAEIKQPELVRTIEQQAQSAGVDLTGIAPSEPLEMEGSDTPIIVLPMAITAEGRYANIKTFVDNMERIDRAFLINTVDVVTGQQLDSYTLTLNGDFFSLPEGTLAIPGSEDSAPSNAPATAAPTPGPTGAAPAPADRAPTSPASPPAASPTPAPSSAAASPAPVPGQPTVGPTKTR